MPAPILPYSAIFLDRDGVINEERNYCHKWEEFTFIDGAIEFMQYANSISDHLIIVTNQAGIAKGYFTLSQYDELTSRMIYELQKNKITVDNVYFCPHHPEGSGVYKKKCNCRKPAPGMILKACEDYHIDIKRAILIGDKLSDIEAAKSAGIDNAFYVETGHEILQSDLSKSKGVFKDLYEAKFWLQMEIGLR